MANWATVVERVNITMNSLSNAIFGSMEEVKAVQLFLYSVSQFVQIFTACFHLRMVIECNMWYSVAVLRHSMMILRKK